MKVVFQSSSTCCQNETGGVQIRLRKIASLLVKCGVEVEFFNAFTTKFHRGDILHVFMLSLDNYPLVQYAKAMGVKIVISTIIPLIGEAKLFTYKLIHTKSKIKNNTIHLFYLKYRKILLALLFQNKFLFL